MKSMKIGILYNQPVATSTASMDILRQVAAVETALNELGHPSTRIPFTRNLADVIELLAKHQVEMVFNLCESVDDKAELGGHPAAMLELIGMPFSGSPAVSLMLTTDKISTKRLIRSSGVLTPNYVAHDPGEPVKSRHLTFPVIVKPRQEDASIGIDQSSIFTSEKALLRKIPEMTALYGPLLIEEYIEGREFNISLLGYPHARPLPTAEIDFSAFPQNMYRIVGYKAKWAEESFEYQHTPRRFPADLPRSVQRKLDMTAVLCFQLLLLRDYGRVDMRLAPNGKLYVLEVNANPCISPDAGFTAAAAQSGLNYTQMVERILHFTHTRYVKHAHPSLAIPA